MGGRSWFGLRRGEIWTPTPTWGSMRSRGRGGQVRTSALYNHNHNHNHMYCSYLDGRKGGICLSERERVGRWALRRSFRCKFILHYLHYLAFPYRTGPNPQNIPSTEPSTETYRPPSGQLLPRTCVVTAWQTSVDSARRAHAGWHCTTVPSDQTHPLSATVGTCTWYCRAHGPTSWVRTLRYLGTLPMPRR